MPSHLNAPMRSVKSTPIVVLVGNPNCGKTTLFNALTGTWRQVGNWAGVTVERKSGICHFRNQPIEIIDLPGTYTLTTIDLEGPQDESLTAEFLKSQHFTCVLNIVDAMNLERSLYLTLQCIEQKLPLIIALNRMDVAEKHRQHLNIACLAEEFGCKVIPLSARQREGIENLKEHLLQPLTAATFELFYPPIIEEALSELKTYCQVTQAKELPRYQLLRWLEGECIPCNPELTSKIQRLQNIIMQKAGFSADIIIAKTRYDYLEGLVKRIRSNKKVKEKQPEVYSWFSQMLDKWVCHRWLGLPLFLAVMYGLFFFAINIGGAFQDFFEQSSHAIFVDGLEKLLRASQAPPWVMALFISGVGEGINTIVTFIPVIGAMFFALAFLEDCGYMARAAFVVDRLMRAVGLPGKSFVPMIVGFGCNVPAIMGARILDSKRDRILAVMMSPFMSCGARLAIFTVFVAAFFPHGGQNIVFLLYLIGISMAVLTGFMLKKTLLRGEVTPLLLEMPNYQWPHWQSLWLHCWHRLRRFILNAGRLILPVCIVIGMLNSFSIKGQWLQTPDQTSLLSVIGQRLTPIFKPMGIEQDNWPATVGLFTGVLAKEVVIGTLNSLYSHPLDNQQNNQALPTVAESLLTAVKTIPANFKELAYAWRNPIKARSPEIAVEHHAYGEMVKKFKDKTNAFAYLLFVLLYFPCISATAAMVREVQKGWTLFSVCWTTGLAYAVAVIYFQCATFALHPIQSISWIVLWVVIGLGTFAGIHYYSRLYLPRIVPTPIVIK